MRVQLEPLLYAAGVDLVVAGHVPTAHTPWDPHTRWDPTLVVAGHVPTAHTMHVPTAYTSAVFLTDDSCMICVRVLQACARIRAHAPALRRRGPRVRPHAPHARRRRQP
jgi:hypothetical protein